MKERVQCTFLFYSLELCQGQQQYGGGLGGEQGVERKYHQG